MSRDAEAGSVLCGVRREAKQRCTGGSSQSGRAAAVVAGLQRHWRLLGAKAQMTWPALLTGKAAAGPAPARGGNVSGMESLLKGSAKSQDADSTGKGGLSVLPTGSGQR